MKKKRFHYAISGYRWAPESYRVSKRLAENFCSVIPLTPDEQREMVIFLMRDGFDTAIGYVKHMERVKERQCKSVMTYGFLAREAPGQFVYCPQLYFPFDIGIDERLRMFKKIRGVLEETDGRVTVFTECELNGEYDPVNIRKSTVTADFSRPVCIPMGKMIIRDCLEQPYWPHT